MFRVVVIVGVAMAPVILLALMVDPLVGAILFGIEIGVLIGFLFQRSRGAEPRTAEVASSDDDVHRVLVVANQTVGGRALLDEIKQRVSGEGRSEILVVTPPLAKSAAEHWSSDIDEGIADAQQRLEASVATMRAGRAERSGSAGRPSRPEPGDRGRAGRVRRRRGDHLDPHAEALAMARVGRGREGRSELPQPVTHVVVDLEAEAGAQAGEPEVRAG